MHMRRSVYALLVSTLLGAWAAPATAQDRPRLLLSRDELPRVRAALEGELAPVATGIGRGVDAAYEGSFPRTPDPSWTYFSDARAIGDSLFSFAFAAFVWGDDGDERARRSVELARSYLNGICSYGDWVFASRQDGATPDLYSAHFLMDVAVAYDWLYDRLSDAERARCRATVAREGRAMYEAAIGGAWWADDRLQNHHWINHAALGTAALAFDAEIEAPTRDWKRAADVALARANAAMDLIEGGAWHEGCGYANYGLESLVIYGQALRRRGEPDVAEAALLRDLPTLRAMTMPAALAHRREYPIWGDFSNFGNDSTLAFVAHRMRFGRDRLAAWYARRFIEGGGAGRTGITSWPPSHRGPIMAALFWDSSVEPAPPAALDHVASDLSLFTTRSGFDEGDVMVVLKNGPFGGHGNFARVRDGGGSEGSINYGHDHADDLGVQIFGDGEWLTVPVPGYWIGRVNGDPEANRTRYANSILVDGLGQLGEGPRRGSSASADALDWFWDRTGRIEAHGATRRQAFAVADGAALYPRSRGMTRVERTLVHADREVVLVRDRLESSASHRYEVTWHAIDDAVRDGAWLRLEAKNGRALGVRVLAPPRFEITTERQTARHTDRFDPDGSLTAVFVRPAADGPAQTFLHALLPVRTAAWPRRLRVEPVDGVRRDVGATIEREGGSTTVVFERAGGIEHDGVAAVVGRAGGAVERAALLSGSELRVDGTRWIEVLEGAPASAEVELRERELVLSGDPVLVRVHAPGVERVIVADREVAFRREGEHVVVGPGAIVEDAGRDVDAGALRTDAAAFTPDASTPSSAGGGCSAVGGTTGGAWVLALGLLGIARRRRRALSMLASLLALVGCAEPQPGGVMDAGREDAGAWVARDASRSVRDGAPSDGPSDAGTGVDAPAEDAGVDGGSRETVDCFGTRAIYPTVEGGREWCLPADPTRASGAWRPHRAAVGAGSEPGTLLSDGSPRHSVTSLEGDAWWQNVEMTVYVRWLSGRSDEELTLYARGERHSDGLASMSDINEGVRAPLGTEAWPGYPFARSVPRRCLGTAYKASLAIDGTAFFKKEISHTAGYTSAAGRVTVFPGGLPRGAWVGFKMVLRNAGDGVRMEIWVDREGNGDFGVAPVTSYEDRGGWRGDPASDGCDAAPLGYTRDQLVRWAGPIAVLRADEQRFEMRAFSIREIAPLP